MRPRPAQRLQRPVFKVYDRNNPPPAEQPLSYASAFDLTREGKWAELHDLTVLYRDRLKQLSTIICQRGKADTYTKLDDEIRLLDEMAYFLAIFANDIQLMNAKRDELEVIWCMRQRKYGDSLVHYTRVCEKLSSNSAKSWKPTLVTWGQKS